AFREAAEKAEPCLLEPIMHLEANCPADDVGSVVGDVMRRGGTVLGMDHRDEDRIVRAEVPRAEMVGDVSALTALTHGRGRFTLSPARYEPVPAARAKLLVVNQ